MTVSASNRVVVLASADSLLRQRVGANLRAMRWRVCEAGGGAEAIAQIEEHSPEALLLDSWFPDLDIGELTAVVRQIFPQVDLLRIDGTAEGGATPSRGRNELLHALRKAGDGEAVTPGLSYPDGQSREGTATRTKVETPAEVSFKAATPVRAGSKAEFAPVLGMVGKSGAMRELARLVRLVAPTNARVLIEGETGTGKELVAKALHVLSARAGKPFVVLNCAAIPEALLEAELFGHTRGAFTGAVQSRVGRIEAAHGGTLFLDEIGEMPLPLQAKLLRFLENGELQKVGENQAVRVDVRVIAATHQMLESKAAEGSFRLDLFHRLCVFPIEVPSLRERLGDIPILAEHFLEELGKDFPRKRLHRSALEKLQTHPWPGNVRELGHVLQRAAILTDERPEITEDEIVLRRGRGLIQPQ